MWVKASLMTIRSHEIGNTKYGTVPSMKYLVPLPGHEPGRADGVGAKPSAERCIDLLAPNGPCSEVAGARGGKRDGGGLKAGEKE